MSPSAVGLKPLAVGAICDDTKLTVRLADGREIIVPLQWFPRLLAASSAARENWRLIANGEGIHWADIDEDVSVAGLLGIAD